MRHSGLTFNPENAVLNISRLSYRVAGRTLIDNSSINISSGWHVGIVGLNGTGKSTLFKIIMKELEMDGGTITTNPRHRIGMVRQDMPDVDTPLIDLVLEADVERTALLRETETMEDPMRMADVYARLDEIEAHSAPARAAVILSGLGFSAEQQTQPFSSFSGGWRMRVALAAVLFSQPEVLLLDEPTNHLDLEAIIWLEGYLATYPHTMLIISHDRDLLNKCVDHIVHLYDKKLTTYTGNYDTFERERASKLELQQKSHEKQTAQRAHIQKFIDRFKAKASKARQAQSRIKMLEKMDVVDAVIADRGMRFTFPQPDKLPSPLISINKVNIGYTPGKPVLREIDDTIDMDDRIALLGANGNGKSTLIKLIAGKLSPQVGELVKSGKLKIGYFSQHQTDELNLDSTPFLEMTALYAHHKIAAREPQVRGRLGQFNFSKELQDNKIRTLSGGEKARLLFAFISFEAPHLLLLDEPTNHLDIDARAALVDALNEYEGAVVIVSHDPSMLERVATRLWLVNEGRVQDFEGDVDDYRKFVIDNKRAGKKADKQKRNDAKADSRKASADQRLALAPLAEQAAAMEKELEKLNKERVKMEALMAQADFYSDKTKAQQTQLKHGQLLKQIEAKEAEWLAAVDTYEKAKAEAA